MSDADDINEKQFKEAKAKLENPIVVLKDGREIHSSDIYNLSSTDKHRLRMQLMLGFESGLRKTLPNIAEQDLKHAIITAKVAVRNVDLISKKNPEVARELAKSIDYWPTLHWTKDAMREQSSIELLDLKIGDATRLKSNNKKQDALYKLIDGTLYYLLDSNDKMAVHLGFTAEGHRIYSFQEKPSDVSASNYREISRILARYLIYRDDFRIGLAKKRVELADKVIKELRLDLAATAKAISSPLLEFSWSNIEANRNSRLSTRIKKLPDISTGDCVALTQYEAKRADIERSPYTLSDIRKGLEKTIGDRLKSILR